MATIRKRGDKWHVQIRRQGAPSQTRSFSLKTDAELWARQMETELDRRGLPPDPRVARKTILSELLIRYRDTVVSRKRSHHAETKMINALLRQPFAKLAVADVTPAVLSVYRDKRLIRIKPSSLCREFSILQSLFQTAIREWGIPLSDNPVKAVAKPRIGPGRTRRIDGALELASLIECAKDCRNPYMAPLFLFALETGMRRGELVNIRWTDINVERRTLHIPVTKNGHPRTIPLSSTALAILAEIRKTEDERVFPISAQSASQIWRRLRERAGASGLRLHDLRHEAVSSFFERGLSVPEVALISGHRDARMLFRYTHLKAEDVAAKLG